MAVGVNDAYRWAFIFGGTMIVLAALTLRFVHPERVSFESIDNIETVPATDGTNENYHGR